MASGGKRRRRDGDGGGDSTAALPTSILALILSLIPLRDTLRCAYLSKPWFAAVRELLAPAADLDFGEDFAQGLPVERYSSMVNAALELRQGCDALNILKIFFRVGSAVQLACAEATLLKMAALKRSREVDLVLVIGQHFRRNFYYRWLSEPFAFTSTPAHCWRCITRLSLIWEGQDLLAPLDYLSLDPRLDLPLLQLLSLHRVQLTVFLASLFDGCPLLSTVKLSECSWTNGGLKISSLQLSSLELFQCNTSEGPFELDAPALRSFYCSGYMMCLFLENAVALADVYICIIWGRPSSKRYRNYDRVDDWFLPGLVDHVTTLTLCEGSIMELIIKYRKTVNLTFYSLQTLQLILLDEPSIEIVWQLLHDCSVPVLENLFIEFARKDSFQYNTENYCRQMPIVPLTMLRFVSIRGYAGLGDELTIVRCFLANAMSLEIMVVQLDKCLGPYYEDVLVNLQLKLEGSRKASKIAKIFVCRDADDVVGVPPPPHADFHSKGFGYYLQWSKAYHSTAEA